MNYLVEIFKDNIYQVVEYTMVYEEVERIVKFQGTLSDCEAWIRLTKEGYM